MKYLFPFFLWIVACQDPLIVKSPSTRYEVLDTITVTDPLLSDSLVFNFTPYRNILVEGYIVNNNYVLYQTPKVSKKLLVDLTSFKQKNDIFAVDKNGVYYKDNFIKIDTTGFNIVECKATYNKNGNYIGEECIWRTNQKVFNKVEEMKISDPTTFVSVTSNYFKDKNFLYYFDQKIEGADISSLQKTPADDNDFISDKNNTYHKGKLFKYQGESVQYIGGNLYKTTKYVLRYNNGEFIQLPSYFDIPTLKKINKKYFIDKNHLYCDDDNTSINPPNLKMPIAKENLNKIKVFDVFVVDGNRVYNRKNLMKNYDAATFATFPDQYYYQYDKNGIYNWNYKLPFHYTHPPKYGKNLFYIKNQNLFIYENQAYYRAYKDSLYAEQLSPKQIEILKEGKTSLKTLLFPDKIASSKREIDLTIFEEIDYFLYKNKYNVYYYDRWNKKLSVVKGFDKTTLKRKFNNFLIDSNYLYYHTTKLLKNKEIELLAIYEGYHSDCGMDTTPNSNYYIFKNIEGYWLVEISNKARVQFLGTELKIGT